MDVITDAGEIPITAEEKLLEFPRGIPGFEAHRSFRLLHEEGRDEPAVYWLQSVQDDTVQLSVTDPATLMVNYEISLDDDESELLQLAEPENCMVLVVLFRDDEDGAIRANFLAPILVNTEARIGMQKVLNQVAGTVTIQSR